MADAPPRFPRLADPVAPRYTKVNVDKLRFDPRTRDSVARRDGKTQIKFKSTLKDRLTTL